MYDSILKKGANAIDFGIRFFSIGSSINGSGDKTLTTCFNKLFMKGIFMRYNSSVYKIGFQLLEDTN